MGTPGPWQGRRGSAAGGVSGALGRRRRGGVGRMCSWALPGSWGNPKGNHFGTHNGTTWVSSFLRIDFLEQVPPGIFWFLPHRLRTRLHRGPLPRPAYFLLQAPPLAPRRPRMQTLAAQALLGLVSPCGFCFPGQGWTRGPLAEAAAAGWRGREGAASHPQP